MFERRIVVAFLMAGVMLLSHSQLTEASEVASMLNEGGALNSGFNLMNFRFNAQVSFIPFLQPVSSCFIYSLKTNTAQKTRLGRPEKSSQSCSF